MSFFRILLRGRILLFAVLLSLAACTSKVTLYTALPEHEANDMLALLQRSGITVEKTIDKTGSTILVNSDQVPQAMALLDNAGLPHPTYAKLGELFAKQGLISSPTEESVRYLYGITEELSHTLSQIDGVLSARVHVVLPGNTPIGENNLPSSAAVLIRYAPNVAVEDLVPKIKELVVNSIAGLSYDRVSVILVKSEPVLATNSQLVTQAPDQTPSFLASPWFYILAALALLSVIGNGALAFILFKRIPAKTAAGDKLPATA